MKIKSIMDMTYQELLDLKCTMDFMKNEQVEFNSLVIVPTNEVHDSGFGCMKYILVNKEQEIVGITGGGSDVVHINGICNGGINRDYNPKNKGGKGYDWRIDCLPASKCLRIFCSKTLIASPCVISDFEFFVKED